MKMKNVHTKAYQLSFCSVSMESLVIIVELLDDSGRSDSLKLEESIVSFMLWVRGSVRLPTLSTFLLMSFLPIRVFISIFSIFPKGSYTTIVPTNPKKMLMIAVGM